MGDESHVIPLAPSRIHHRTDEEMAVTKPKGSNRHQRTSKCPVYILLFLVFLCLASLLFAIVVLRVKSPRLQLTSVAVQNLRHTAPPSPPSLNMTLVVEISAENKNFGRLDYGRSNLTVSYGGTVVVGVGKIKEGSVGAKQTAGMKVRIQVRSSDGKGLDDNMNFSGDINSGMVRLGLRLTMRSVVRVVKIIHRRRTTAMSCSMDLNLATQEIQDLLCL